MCASPKPQRNIACSGEFPLAASLIHSASSFWSGLRELCEALTEILARVKQSVVSSVSCDPASFNSSINFSIKRKCRLRLRLCSASRNSSTMSPEQTWLPADSSADGPASGCVTQNSESSLSIAARKFLIASPAPGSPATSPPVPVRRGISPTASTRMPATLREANVPCKPKSSRAAAARHR